MKISRHLKILLLLLSLTPLFSAVMPEAHAMDPVTIAILAPVALKAAKVAAPYVIRGIVGGFRHMLKMGIDIAKILNLPFGFFQMTLGAPFGYFKQGANNCWIGVMSPFKLTWDALMLPIAFTGIDPPG